MSIRPSTLPTPRRIPRVLPDAGTPVVVQTVDGTAYRGRVRTVARDQRGVPRLLVDEGAGWWEIPLATIHALEVAVRFHQPTPAATFVGSRGAQGQHTPVAAVAARQAGNGTPTTNRPADAVRHHAA